MRHSFVSLSHLCSRRRSKLTCSICPTFESCTSWKREVLVKNVNYDHIFQYLIEMRTKSADDRRRNSYKSLKGYDYFKCGWVVNVWMASPDETLPNYVFLRAHVYQSYPSRSKSPYSVFACLSQQGNVFKGKCGCVAGLGESCSHVAALLFLGRRRRPYIVFRFRYSYSFMFVCIYIIYISVIL